MSLFVKLRTILENPPTIPGSSLDDIERYVIVKTMQSVDGSTRKTAEVLGISVRTIQNRLRGWGIGRKPTEKKVKP